MQTNHRPLDKLQLRNDFGANKYCLKWGKLESESRMIVYYNGQYVQKSEVAISPDDRGFLFADGVYDVIRAYPGKLFRGVEHLDRLEFGLRELRIEGLDAPSLEQVARELIERSKLEASDAVVYIQVTRGAAPRSHEFPNGTPPTVYVQARAYSPPVEQQQNGARAI